MIYKKKFHAKCSTTLNQDTTFNNRAKRVNFLEVPPGDFLFLFNTRLTWNFDEFFVKM